MAKKLVLKQTTIDKWIEVFGDEKSFNKWLHTKILALGYKMSKDLPEEKILETLGRIEHGTYS